MNRVAFQIYGLNKYGFQSTWDTTLVSTLGTETSAIPASGTNWALNAGATNLNVGGYKHTTGSTVSLNTTLSATIMQMYQIIYTITSRTTGSVTVNYGGTVNSGITSTSTINILAIATTMFSITPTSDFDGVIAISIKQTSSATNQIKLPLPNIDTYSIRVDWGDGTSNNITNYNSVNTLHTYSTSGIYTIKITGDIFNFQFNNIGTNDRKKLKTISNWGKLKLGTNSFYGCSNLTLSGINDVPNLSTVTNLSGVFNSCVLITTIGKINEWNVSNISNLTKMFYSTAFNQNIGAWNVSSVTVFSEMFFGTPFNNGGSSSIDSWQLKTSGPISLDNIFQSATTFNQPIGSWNTSAVTNMSKAFNNATTFNQNINSWNVSNATDTSSMFWSATAFNQPLNSWNVTGVTNMSNMFRSAVSFNQPLNSWNPLNVTTMVSMFQVASTFNGNLSGWDVSKVTAFSSMFQEAAAFNNGVVAGSGGTMTWTINTTTPVVMNSMFYNHYSFNQDIGNWDVSKVTNFSSFMYHDNGSQTNTFNNGYSDTIKNWNVGSCTNFVNMFVRCRFNQPVNLWDMSKATTISGMFLGCASFNNGFASGVSAGNQLPWNTSLCTDMSSTFSICGSFNSNLGNGTTPWDVNKVTTFASMFSNAVKFNSGDNTADINTWNINTATTVNMSGIFNGAIIFNRGLNSWNTSAVTNMSGMFQTATAFNQPLNLWDTANVTNMGSMFSRVGAGISQFNQNIGAWNVTKVTTFTYMFYSNGGSISFNNAGSADINNWVLNTTTSVGMEGMFLSSPFNQPVGNWNVSKVTNMGGIFKGTPFNQDISTWDVSAVTLMFEMFSNNTVFNQNITGWNVSAVTNMSLMFINAIAFNQNIGSWNVSGVTNMLSMFQNATAFNQNIGAWNVSNVTNFTSFMASKTAANFSTTNLDAIYNGWSSRAVKPSITITFGTAKYTAGSSAGKAILTNSPNLWTITDGGI